MQELPDLERASKLIDEYSQGSHCVHVEKAFKGHPNVHVKYVPRGVDIWTCIEVTFKGIGISTSLAVIKYIANWLRAHRVAEMTKVHRSPGENLSLNNLTIAEQVTLIEDNRPIYIIPFTGYIPGS